MKHIALLFASLIFFFSGLAQNQLQHKIRSYQADDGKLYWNKNLPFHIRISPTANDSGYLMQSEVTAKYANPSYFDTEGKNRIRTKHAVDVETKKAIVPQIEIIWEVYVDGIAPESSVEFLDAEKHTSNGITYYGKNLRIKITSEDNLAGLDRTLYSLNGLEYSDYIDILEMNSEGSHKLAFYASDLVGNAEEATIKDFAVDHTAPITKHIVKGSQQDNIIASSTDISLEITDNLSGVKKTYYTIDGGDEKNYNGKYIPTSQLKDGEHTLKYYSIDNVGNKEKENTFVFYLDKLAPILASDILGDRFIVKDQIYFSGRTKLKLTAVDNKSGVKEVLFAIDSEDFSAYDQPFYLPSVPGIHIIRYFAIDNMANETGGKKSIRQRYQEFKHNVSKIYVDLTGPNMDYEYIGSHFKARDTVFVNPETKIKLKGSDGESGFQYLSYSIDGAKEETRYTEPFTVNQAGLHKIEYFSYDNVNNRNKGNFHFIVDNEAPKINYSFSIEPIAKKELLDVYPDYVMMYLSATDVLVGTDVIHYQINDGPETKFFRYITGFEKGKVNIIKIRAADKLGNTTQTEFSVFIE